MVTSGTPFMGPEVSMNSSHSAWWVELAFESASPNFSACAACGESVDSMDVVCPKDEASLLGGLAGEGVITFAAYVFRALVVLAALAIGYLRLTWPAYFVGVILALTFSLLFLRNHSIALKYLAAAVLLIATAHWLWVATDYARPTDVAWILFTLGLIANLAFAIGLTRVYSDDNMFPDLEVSTSTVVVATGAIIAACASLLVIVVGYLRLALAPQWLLWASIHGLPLILSAGAFAVLVSSIAYTVAAVRFTVPDIFRFRDVLGIATLGRIPSPVHNLAQTGLDRVISGLERVLISFANGLTAALEHAYNRQARVLVNGAARVAVAWANSICRWLVKTARHVVRTVRRFIVVALKCMRWSWTITQRFATAFAAPALLSWLACAELWWVAEEVRGYLLNERSWATPLLSLGRIIIVVMLLAGSTMLMLKVSPAAFANKLSAAASAIGGRAFLFFVFIAWALGVVGWATGGPFRVGWVTLASTSIIVAALFALRARRAVPAVS